MEQEGGGWTTIQRRVDGSVDFRRDWAEYKKGFGHPSGEYWLGLDHIHTITNSFANVMLRIEASAFNGDRAVLVFEKVFVCDEANLYRLMCGQFVDGEPSLANSWLMMNGMAFSTKDVDNGQHSIWKCAVTRLTIIAALSKDKK